VGTQVSKNFGVIIYGFKIANRAAVCPLSKQPLWPREADGQSAQSLILSYENCIPLKLIVGKETPKLINWALKDNFDLFAKEEKLRDGESSTMLGDGFSHCVVLLMPTRRCIGLAWVVVVQLRCTRNHALVVPLNLTT
jgi:hypothetical protein